MNGATFVARGYSGDIKHLTELMKKAIQHKGFSLIDIFSPCVVFNNDNGHDFFKERIKKLEDQDHDPSDWKSACEKAIEWDNTIYTGLFFEADVPTLDQEEPVLHEGGPLARMPLGFSDQQAQKVINRRM